MSTEGKRWIVKDDDGRIYGPFSSEQVLAEIEKGFFVGNEQVAIYPGGKWLAISAAIEFSDKLLDMLAQEGKPQTTKSESKIADKRPGVDDNEERNTPSPSRASRVVQVSSNKMNPPSRPLPPKAKEVAPDIELTDLKALKKQRQAQIAKLPVMLLGGALFLVVIALIFRPGSGDSRKIQLIAPRKGQAEINVDKVKEKFAKGLQFFQQDTLSGYLKAQNEFVQIVEGAPMNAEAFAMLCMTYREVWPYTPQDSYDDKVLNYVLQSVKKIDPIGYNGATCEIVQRLLKGRTRDAEILLETWLATRPDSPGMLDMRAEIFYMAKNFSFASAWYERSKSVWPQWLKPYVMEARSRAEDKQYGMALQIFRNVLQANPDHDIAKVESAVIEMEQFKQNDKAYDLAQSALSGERLPVQVHSTALYVVANVLATRNQQNKALEYAKKSYALNRGNMAARQLIVMLGGSTEGSDDPRGLVPLGDQLYDAGKYFEAQAQYKAAFDADPKNAIAAMKAARCLWKLNQSTDAIEWARKAIEADKKLVAAYIDLADYYSQRFDYLSAARVLQRVQAISPRNHEVLRGFAMVELSRFNYKGAIGYLQQALKIYDSDVQTYIMFAKAHSALREYAEANRYISYATDADPNNIEAQCVKAKVVAGLQGTRAGIAYAQGLINRYNTVVDYYLVLGDIYFSNDQFKFAEDTYRQALSVEATNKLAKLNLGKSIHKQGRLPEALEVFLEAAVLDPLDAQAIFQAGLVYYDHGKFPDAIAQFKRVLKINERYPRAHLQIGRSALQMGNAEEAMREADQERALNPELAEAYILLAEAHYARREYAGCATQYQKAVAKRAATSDIYVKMARCYRLTGALDPAVSLLRKAASVESGNPDIYKEQGAVFQSKGMAAEAITAYEQYLVLVPNARDREDVQGQIRRIQSGQIGPEGD